MTAIPLATTMSPPQHWKGWVASYLLPVSAATIGRLVPDRASPDQDFHDTVSSNPGGYEALVSMTQANSFQTITAESSGNGLSVLATALLGAKYNIKKEEIIDIVADSCTTRVLSNASDYFNAAIQSASVQIWLGQAWKKRRHVYLVVGIKTLTNAKIALHVSKSKASDYSVKLPGSLVLAAATQGAVISAGGLESVLDSEVGTTGATVASLVSRIDLPGEHIYAIQYRKVDFPSWFQRPTMDRFGLMEGTKGIDWKSYVGARSGKHGDGEEGNDDGPRLAEEEDADDVEDLGHDAFVVDKEEVWCLR
jgi:hypothetical protein